MESRNVSVNNGSLAMLPEVQQGQISSEWVKKIENEKFIQNFMQFYLLVDIFIRLGASASFNNRKY